MDGYKIVALRKESVDRNHKLAPCFLLFKVALRKESVDRNPTIILYAFLGVVALRKESVDRNLVVWAVVRVCELSLSARRAWIEIGNKKAPARVSKVALRKESVDRNCHEIQAYTCTGESLSARRAWIEITYVTRLPRAQVCRSPQGERG